MGHTDKDHFHKTFRPHCMCGHSHFPSMLSFFVTHGNQTAKAGSQKRKVDDSAHCCTVAASKRASQYVGVMELRGGAIWCNDCKRRVQHHNPNFAISHVKFERH